MNDEDRTPFDDFLEEILKREGDTGDDFKLGSIDAEIMRWALHLIAMAFVACHVETRQRYMPAVPTRTLNQDLVQWTVEHMRRFVDRLRTGNFPITNEQVQAIETILMRQSQDILAILDLPPESKPQPLPRDYWELRRSCLVINRMRFLTHNKPLSTYSEKLYL